MGVTIKNILIWCSSPSKYNPQKKPSEWDGKTEQQSLAYHVWVSGSILSYKRDKNGTYFRQ